MLNQTVQASDRVRVFGEPIPAIVLFNKEDLPLFILAQADAAFVAAPYPLFTPAHIRDNRHQTTHSETNGHQSSRREALPHPSGRRETLQPHKDD